MTRLRDEHRGRHLARKQLSDFDIRPFRTHAEFRECVRLQELTWGEGFSERAPISLMKVSQRLGGVAAGAYDAEGALAGFVFGLAGWENGSPVHWSDMLAVRPELRDTGLGTRLKAYQREVVLSAGVRRMYWTFDPLESRNAYLNLAKLGIVVREHVRDMYGRTDSPLHRGIGTDRFVALWELDLPRVERRLAGHEVPPHMDQLAHVPRALVVAGNEAGGGPELGAEVAVDSAEVLVAIPSDIQSVKSTALATAVLWREATREIFDDYLSRGYEVRELIRDRNLSHYLLVRTA